jgi:hypothetical protein
MKKIFFSGYTPPKISFFTNYTTWQTSNFYSTDRVNPDAPLKMKIEKAKKNFLFEKGGGGPLKHIKADFERIKAAEKY